MRLERVILSNLIHNEEYVRRVGSHIRPEYFVESSERFVFETIDGLFRKYNVRPTVNTIAVSLGKSELIRSDDTYREMAEIVSSLTEDRSDLQWLIDETEKFCQDKAIYNGIKRAIAILDGKTEDGKGAIPEILTQALGVSFDVKIGHDFIEDSDARFNYYRSNVARIPMDLEFFNQVTGGGTPRKTLNVFMGGVHVGKSLFLCHISAAALKAGLNVLYVTLELSEEEVGRRIDANVLDVPIADLALVPKDSLTRKVDRLRAQTKGKLIIKEYPTSCAGVGQFRHLLNELRLKKSFKPDLIVVDYINICASSRMKYGAQVNSYTLVKAIAEELRGLAVEYDVPIWSATQTNREGFASSDLGMENVAESFGLPATADFMAAIINTEELEKLGQLMVKQLKNRYTDAGLCRRFIVGVDRTKMRLYDVEQTAQEGVTDGPVMDNTKFGEEDAERSKKRRKKFNFSDFK